MVFRELRGDQLSLTEYKGEEDYILLPACKGGGGVGLEYYRALGEDQINVFATKPKFSDTPLPFRPPPPLRL